MGIRQYLISFEIAIRKEEKYLRESKKRKNAVKITITDNELNVNK